MNYARQIFFACALLVSSSVLAQTAQLITTIQGVSEYRLENGLQILLAPDNARDQTTVNMSYRVGSRHEGHGETGMAHLLEHLIFRPSPNYPDAMAEFARRGLAANGSTTVDLTNYYATFAAKAETLQWYLGWQADAMQHASISRADLDAEMTVVRNEMERAENSPFAMLMQQLRAVAYVWHPYGRSVIGARSDVENVDVDQLRAFYQRHYQPDRATLIIAGRFDPEQTLQWVVSAFGPIARPERPLAPEYTTEPVQEGARAVTLSRPGGSPLALLQYHLPAAMAEDFPALALGAAMLADSPAGPLHQDLVVKAGRASSVFGFAQAQFQPGYAVFGAQVLPEASAAEVLRELEQSIASASARLDDAALKRVRTAWLNQWQQTYNHPASLAAALSEAVSRGDWRLFFVRPLQVEAVKLADIQRLLAAWLLPANSSSGLYLPDEQPRYAPAPGPADISSWLAKLPTGTQREQLAAFDTSAQALDAATIHQSLELTNTRVELALLPKPTPGAEVRAILSLRFGTLDELRGLNLIPDITVAMLARGAMGLSRQQIEDRVNELDSDLSFDLSDNILKVYLRTKREHLPALLQLALGILRQPDFPQDELDELSAQIRTSLNNQQSSPGYLVGNTLARHGQPWEPDDLRYTPSAEENLQYLQRLSARELREFQRRFIGAGDLGLALVGDFDPAAIADMISPLLADWQPAPAWERIPKPWYPVVPESFELAAPGKANAEYLANAPLQIQDTDPRWPALTMANYLLGGSEDSFLWQRIRVELGLSYGVGSRVAASSFEPTGSWSIHASAAAANSGALAAAIQSALQEALATGFTDAQIKQAATSLENFLQLGRSSDGALVGRLARYLETGRNFMWQQKFIEQLHALGAPEVNAALRELLRPEALSIAVTADKP